MTALRKAALADERILDYLHDVADCHGVLVTTHKNPVLPINKLLFLLDLGFDTDIPEIKTAIDEIKRHRDANGVYQSLTNVPKRYGGAGEDVFSWCLCDAPRLLLALLKAGVDYKESIQPGVDYLVSLCRENGFPCAVSPELGTFRGPGRKTDCCPYATLIMADSACTHTGISGFFRRNRLGTGAPVALGGQPRATSLSVLHGYGLSKAESPVLLV
jgi:hypothetical protein